MVQRRSLRKQARARGREAPCREGPLHVHHAVIVQEVVLSPRQPRHAPRFPGRPDDPDDPKLAAKGVHGEGEDPAVLPRQGVHEPVPADDGTVGHAAATGDRRDDPVQEPVAPTDEEDIAGVHGFEQKKKQTIYLFTFAFPPGPATRAPRPVPPRHCRHRRRGSGLRRSCCSCCRT